MLKPTLFILLLVCTMTFGASTLRSADSENSRYAAKERLKDITVEKLTPEQLKLIQNGAQELNVTIDDILFYIRLSAENLQLARSFRAQLYKHGDILHQMTVEITEFNNPKEVSIEDLQKNHPELMDKLVKELNATSDEILHLTRFMIITEHDKINDFGDLMRKIRGETTLCPVPPEKTSENPSSDEMQKYIRLMVSSDFAPNMTVPSQMVKFTERFCLIPDSLINKLSGMSKVWVDFSISSEADYSTRS